MAKGTSSEAGAVAYCEGGERVDNFLGVASCSHRAWSPKAAPSWVILAKVTLNQAAAAAYSGPLVQDPHCSEDLAPGQKSRRIWPKCSTIPDLSRTGQGLTLDIKKPMKSMNSYGSRCLPKQILGDREEVARSWYLGICCAGAHTGRA